MKRKSSADKSVIHLPFSILFHSKVSISIFHKYTSQDKPIKEENEVYTAILTNLLGSNILQKDFKMKQSKRTS